MSRQSSSQPTGECSEEASLRQVAAGPGSPIIGLGDPAGFPIACQPMDKEWKARFDALYPTLDVIPASLEGKLSFPARRRLFILRDILVSGLLGFGGERVCLPAWEPDLKHLVNRGQLFNPQCAIMLPGEVGHCHGNAARRWEEDPDQTLLATGYYLPADGVWRQHSWCIDISEPEAPCIVETVMLARAYFGFVMTSTEAEQFADSQF